MVVALATVALATTASGATAATTVGGKLDSTPTSYGCVGYGPGVVMPGVTIGCTIQQTVAAPAFSVGSTSPIATGGVVTRFHILTGASGAGTSRVVVAPRVLNPALDVVATGTPQDIPLGIAGVHSFDTQLPVTSGQHLAMHLEFTAGPLAGSETVGIKWVYVAPSGTAGSTAKKSGTLPGPTSLATPDSTSANGEAMVAYDIEPDVDGDGLGDETQDTAPPTLKQSVRARQNVVRGRGISLLITSSETGTVTIGGLVKVGGELGSLTLASRTIAVDAGVAKRVRLPIPARRLKKIKAALKSGKSVSVRTQVFATNVIGRSSQTQSKTVRAAKIR